MMEKTIEKEIDLGGLDRKELQMRMMNEGEEKK